MKTCAVLFVLLLGLFPSIASAYENLALNKPAEQLYSHEARWGAYRAVDGMSSNLEAGGNQCTISGNEKNIAKWWVDLEKVFSIHHIFIQYRTDNVYWDASNGFTERFLGFSVYISNTTNKEDGVLCFRDTSYTKATIPNPVSITCPYHGRYVIYYNNRTHPPYPEGYSPYAYNELCELEVIGCPTPGYYGESCSLPCPQNCQEDRCHITEGSCLGCVPGYIGDKCDAICNGNTYGQECNTSCGNCINGEQCHHMTGICPNGCDKGVYDGDKCDQACPPGWYGKNCSKECGPNCIPSCDRFEGDCKLGCKPGWKGSFCDTKCDDGTYGVNCSQKCGACVNNEACHHINGTCLSGCDRGYRGQKCEEECPDGLYGYNCNKTCSMTCKGPGRCHRKTGSCNGSCLAGWKGEMCENECDGDTFGQDCGEECGECVNDEQCHHINGTCLNGCDRGVHGLECNQVCVNGTFGFNCNETCPEHCSNRTCDAKRGKCLQEPLQHKDDPGDNTGLAAGAGVGGAVVVILVIIGVIVFIRMRSAKPKENESTSELGRHQRKTEDKLANNSYEKQRFTDIYENTEKGRYLSTAHEKTAKGNAPAAKKYETKDEDFDEEGIENPYGDLYINEETISDVQIRDLGQVIKDKRRNEDDGFKREYAMLPSGEQYPCDVGKQQENLPRNRFKTTFPYDHSRIILRREHGISTDYINANYINGTDTEKQYIASQGPKQNTLNDFWAMIWQENVTQIVMLTNLKEGVKLKCTQYWPEKMKARLHGDIVIKNVEEKEYAFYVIRKLTVSLKEQKKSRVVTQYHYTTWPDHGTPDPLSLVVFYSHVLRTKTNQNKAPVVVHCSAGIGRTGTYIALDALYKSGKASGKINVAEYVKVMRSNRMNMVQTYEQYMTIFLALNEEFKAPVRMLNVPDFNQKVQSLTGDRPANQTVIRKEFEKLIGIKPEYTDADYKISKQHLQNKSGTTLLPLDKYTLYLTSSVPRRGNFINAIKVPSYVRDTAFIVTQYPPPGDAVDFLRLLNDHESDTVICMNPLSEMQSFNSWFPQPHADKTVTPFTVHHESEIETDVKVTNVNILNGEEAPHLVAFVEPRGSLKTTGNAQDTSHIRALVSFALNLSTENPITIVSKDGASLCGVFCAVFNSIQQINMDDSVDVFTTVRQLQTRRPEFCSTQEEYLLVYRALQDYNEATDENVYCNQ
uniref:protein-tyrosine-phosphatase n=1 Tax=Crassostrea virginica TaxID=6565 RepID=A0A8B8BU72_CRAVI|nr:receptor-type tyrosine-protein phosphatase T-like [Crassostrea virginica]